MKFRWSLWLLASLTAGTASAQVLSLYTIDHPETRELDRIAANYEIINRNGDTYSIYVKQELQTKFQHDFPTAHKIADDADSSWKPQFQSQKTTATGYHNFQTVQDFMDQVVATYPTLASVQSYGKSGQGRELRLLHLNTPVNKGTAKPKLFLDAATHGDELISTEVLLSLTDELLKGYGKDQRLTKILDGVDLSLSFVVNPDGYVHQDRYDEGVDPNRSYPWPGDVNHKPTTSIKALMDLYAKEQFTGSITFHAFGRMLMYPWGYTTSPIQDSTDRMTFDTLCDKLALGNGYKHGPIATTIYVAKGSSADYYYWKYHTQAYAVELSSNKVPQASQIPAVVNEAREMVWLFLEHFQSAKN